MVKKKRIQLSALLLSNQDSNLDWLIQSQMCYHYTIGHLLFSSRKRMQRYNFFYKPNFFLTFFHIFRL